MRLLRLTLIALLAAPASASLIVNYTTDAGGNNTEPLNGLEATATFSVDDTHLTILLENTSTGVPASFESDPASSLLVSLGFDLPDLEIVSGNSAVIAPGSVGIGKWHDLIAGDSVAEQWLWTNNFGGDLMETRKHVISTSNGQGAGTEALFGGGSGNVSGPFGGIAAAPPLVAVPSSKPAVSSAILFDLTLSGALTEAQLYDVAHSGMIEFGSDARYLTAPEPGSLVLAGLAVIFLRRRC